MIKKIIKLRMMNTLNEYGLPLNYCFEIGNRIHIDLHSEVASEKFQNEAIISDFYGTTVLARQPDEIHTSWCPEPHYRTGNS